MASLASCIDFYDVIFLLWTCLADSRTETKSTAKHDIHTDDFEAGKKIKY